MMMFIALMVLPLVAASGSVSGTGCTLPESLVGQWNSTFAGWNDLTITNTSISKLPANRRELKFTCFMNNGTTYVLESEEQSVANIQFYYYTCLDIIPDPTYSYVVFFHVLTERNGKENNDSMVSMFADSVKRYEHICSMNRTELPLDYTMFLKKGFEEHLGNDTCPLTLQAEFAANFTEEMVNMRCTEGFELEGCDHSHLAFNFTTCGSGDGHASGVLNYTCLTSVEKENVTYTYIFLPKDVNPTPTHPYEFACLEETMLDDGELMLTKSAAVCGGTPFVSMEAVETMSCRAPTTIAPEATTTSGGSPAASVSIRALMIPLVAALLCVMTFTAQ